MALFPRISKKRARGVSALENTPRRCGSTGTISREKIAIKGVFIIIPLFVRVRDQRSLLPNVRKNRTGDGFGVCCTILGVYLLYYAHVDVADMHIGLLVAITGQLFYACGYLTLESILKAEAAATDGPPPPKDDTLLVLFLFGP